MTTEPITYTEAEATDEALRMFFRRTRRYTDNVTFKKIMDSLSDGLRDTIHLAENRADKLMWADQKAGITRTVETIAGQTEAQMAAEEIDEA